LTGEISPGKRKDPREEGHSIVIGFWPRFFAKRSLPVVVLALLLASAASLCAQTVQTTQNVERAELLRATPGFPPAPVGSPAPVEGGYAAASPNDADLGQQQILKRVEEYKPFTLQIGAPIYYTSNAALVRRGEQDDVIFAPGVALMYVPQITRTFFAEFGVQEQIFEYADLDALNFQSLDVIAGLVYYLPQLHNLTLRARYDFNRLSDKDWNEFFTNHSIIMNAELPFSLGRAQQFSIGGRIDVSFAASPDAPQRNNYELYLGYLLSLTRSIVIDAVGRVVVHDYHLGDRVDVNEIIGLGASYRLTDWFAISALGNFAWNQSDHSVFDYKVGNVGGALALTLRF
jgi:hypothetical protein